MLAQPETRVTAHANEYLVDGEVGRFTFKTFDLLDRNDREVFCSYSLLPKRTGKQWYQTSGFKETAIFYGVLDRSYRKTDVAINRLRQQPDGGTPLRTLRDLTVSEGEAILRSLEQETLAAFETHGFGEDGRQLAQSTNKAKKGKKCQRNLPSNMCADKVVHAWNEVAQDMNRRGFSEEQIQSTKPTIENSWALDFESPEHTTNVSMDDVSVKKQKPHRKAEPEQSEEELKRIHSSVAHVTHGGKEFTLVATSLCDVVRFTLALLLRNSLIDTNLRFFVDGQRSLQDTILEYFQWHKNVRLVLDWFHLVKKVKEVLSSAMRARSLRNEHAQKVLPLLWYGMVDAAIAYLESIQPSHLKDPEQIKKLTGYLERNRSAIPNYALRSKLGLPNSSNPAERSNNLLVAQRQKNNGMSWSSSGSHALAALSCLVLNHRTKSWVDSRQFSIAFHQAA